MRVERITVGNYKNIAMTTLDCSKMIALVSTNNYGKSNLLEAIQFGLDFISDSAKDRRAKMCWRKAIPLVPSIMNRDYSFCIEFDDPDLGEYRHVRYGFQFSWYNDHGTGAKITDETIEFHSPESVRYTSYLKRNEGKYRSSKATSAFRKLELTDEALAIDAISLANDVEIAEAVRKIARIRYRICDSLELDDSFRPNPIEIDPGSNLLFRNEDIPRMLAGLKEHHEDLYDLFTETIYDLFPEFREITLQTLTAGGDDSVDFFPRTILKSPAETYDADLRIPYRVKNEIHRLMIDSKNLNQPMSMECMSMGTKRVFWLVANAVMANDRNISLLASMKWKQVFIRE